MTRPGLPRMDEVHLHLLRWPGPVGPSQEGFLSRLSPGERSQWAGLGHPERRREFLLARAFGRGLLGAYLSRDPGALGFRKGRRGKPAGRGFGLRFNFSHSGGWVALALGRHPVGVDVETIGGRVPEARRKLLAQRYFSAPERSFVDSQRGPRKASAFLRIFTLKEAHGKARGYGLGFAWDRLAVPCGWWRVSRRDGLEYFSMARGGLQISQVTRHSGGPLSYKIWEWGKAAFSDFLDKGQGWGRKVLSI